MEAWDASLIDCHRPKASSSFCYGKDEKITILFKIGNIFKKDYKLCAFFLILFL